MFRLCLALSLCDLYVGAATALLSALGMILDAFRDATCVIL